MVTYSHDEFYYEDGDNFRETLFNRLYKHHEHIIEEFGWELSEQEELFIDYHYTSLVGAYIVLKNRREQGNEQ